MKELLLKLIGSTIFQITFGALIGFFLSQFSSWQNNRRSDRLLKNELESTLSSQKFLIKTILRNLAMYKVHKQYYYRASKLLEFTGPDPEEEIKSYLDKHYQKGQEARETEEKLDIATQSLIKTVYHLAKIQKLNVNEEKLQKLIKFPHPKSDKFKEIEDLSALPSALEKEEKNLAKKYQQLNSIVDEFCNLI